jgi:manganese transport protein
MGRFAAMALGVVTAIGGFVDMGELITMPSAGATYRYALIWVVVLSVVGAICYAEMAGRIELVSQRTVFQLMRERLGFQLGLVPLVAVMLLNLLTLAAEVSGLVFVIQLVAGVDWFYLIVPVALGLFAFQLFGNWQLLENIPSVLGLALLVVPASVLFGTLHVDWGAVASSLVTPHLPRSDHPLYAITAISLVGAIMTPYEWYFYSSGGREERWTSRDLVVDRVTAIFGYALGSVLAIGLLLGGAVLFFPASISPAHLSQPGLIAMASFGKTGMVLFLLGAGGCVLGASIEVSQATAQSLAQFFGWRWGASRKARDVPAFTIAYGLALLAAVVILFSGVDPVKITVISMVFAVAALPFTFLPMLLVANDETYMGEHRNGTLANSIGWFFLVLLTLAGLAAFPLLVITGAGGG